MFTKDEKNQVLTSNVWIEQEWFDERLTWNRSAFNNLDKLRIPCERLWVCPIALIYRFALASSLIVFNLTI